MEGHVKICIKVVKEHCRPLQGEKYKKLERELKSVAQEIDIKENSSSEIHTVFFSYEKHLRENFKKFECVERDKTYQNSRKYLTPQPLPGAAKDESGSVAEAVNHGEPDRQQNTGAQQPNSDARKNILAKMNGKKDFEGSKNSAPQPPAKDKKSPVAEDVKQGQPTRRQNTPVKGKNGGTDKNAKPGKGDVTSSKGGQQTKPDAKKKMKEKKDDAGSRNSTPQSQTSGNGARSKQEEEDVTLSIDSSDADEWKRQLTDKEDELKDLKDQLMNLAKECGINGETPHLIITEIKETIGELKNQEKELKVQNQPKGKKEIEAELEELKKSIFNVKKVKTSEHDTAKTKAKIQDLHCQEEELMKLKQTVFKPKKGKDEVHSAEDTMKRVSELQSLEEELLKLKRAVFKPNKGKEEAHSTEDTVKRVSELQSQEEELTKLKQFVFTPNKGRDVVHSTEDTVKRVSELQRSETELLEFKKITFDEELMNAAFAGKQNEYKHTVESASSLVQKLKGLLRNTEVERGKLIVAIVGKKDPCSVDDALKALVSVKRARAELQRLLEAICDSEDPLTTDTAVKKVQHLKESVRENHETIQQQKATCDRLEKNISEKEQKYNSLMREKEDMARRMDIGMNRLQKERDDLLKRFSEVAGAKLTDGNPNVTDLSDHNRPIKIGEQYSELYDNAWTDAFEKLTGEGKISERDSIQILLDILENSYTTCKEIAGIRYRNILAELTLLKLATPEDKPSNRNTSGEKKTKQDESKDKVSPITSEEITAMQEFFAHPTQSVDKKILESVLKKVGLRKTDIKYVKDMLKITLEGTSQIVEQGVLKRLVRKEGGNDEQLKFTKPYVEKCVHVCWLMVAQDPPVCLKPSEKKDNKFNRDIYREFTTSGKKIDYVVWPALLLHEGGPLLSKGVAQPKA